MTYFDTSTAHVVALHGSASSSKQWQSLVAYLEDRFTVITPDLPGYGTNKETGVLPGLAGDATSVISEMERIGEPVHLVGHSYGGAIALKIALMRPDLLASLTVYEPVMFSLLMGANVRHMNLFGEIAGVANSIQNSILSDCPETGMKDFFEFWNGTDTWGSLPNAVRDHLTSQAEPVNRNFVRASEDKTRVQDLSVINVPTMIMTGLESPAVTQQLAGMVARAIPGAKLAMLPGLGHMAPMEAADWVNPRILHHVNEVEQYRVTGISTVRWVA